MPQKRENKEVSVPIEKITGKIYLIRGQKVMLDRDLGDLYQVETKQKAELENWRCQLGTSKSETKGLRYKPLN